MSSIAVRGFAAGALVASLVMPAYAQDARVELVRSTRLTAEGQFASVRTRPTSTAVLRRVIAVDLTDVSLEEALVEITRSAGIELTYSKELLPGEKRVTLQAASTRVGDALEQVLRGTGLDVLVSEERMAVLVRRPEPPAEPTLLERRIGTITGRVTDARSGAEVSGASVVVEGTGLRAVTGNTGRYRIANVPAGTYKAVVRQLGYAEAEQFVTVSDGDEAVVDFALEISALRLDEIVATGTAFETRVRTVPNPISVITAREIEQKQAANITELLRGEIPGVMALSAGQDDYSSHIYVRGSGSWSSGTGVDPIKTYIDGVEVAQPSLLSTIDPNSIERIEVIRGPQASAIYGSEAASGVLQIFTKKGHPGLERPRIDLHASVGMIESEYTPSSVGEPLIQDHSLQVSGGSEVLSYRVGTSYAETGEWLLGYGSSTLSFSGGLRTLQGPLTVELTALWSNRDLNSAVSPIYWRWPPGPLCTWCGQPDLVYPNRDHSFGQNTMGLSVEYRMTNRWQHAITLGDDENHWSYHEPEPHNLTPADTFVRLFNQDGRRRSIRYHTAYDAEIANITGRVTLGAEYWYYDVHGSTAENLLNASGTVQTSPQTSVRLTNDGWGNAGYFGMAELGWKEQLFLTVSGRVEDMANLGEEYGRPIQPRIGAAYVWEMGSTEVKLRGQWGKGVRLPPAHARLGSESSSSVVLANPLIGPEEKAGWDAGVDLYWGSQGSLSLTRYSEEGRNLIQLVTINNTSIPWVWQYQNIGRIGSEGWEVEGRVALGPLTVEANYAYSDNVIRELSNTYTSSPTSRYRVGDRIQWVPTHSGGGTATWHFWRGSASLNTSVIADWQALDYVAYYGYLFGGEPYRGSMRAYGVNYSALWKWNLRAEQAVTDQLTALLRVNNLVNNQNADLHNLQVTPGRTMVLGLKFAY